MKSESSSVVGGSMRWLPIAAWAAMLWLLPSAAHATDRIAVVLSSESPADLALAENLAEIAISRLAENRSGELIGTPEVSRLLQRTRAQKDVATCVSQLACFTHLRDELALTLVVEGKLRRDGTRITLELRLLTADTGQQQRHVSRTSNEAVADLIQATRESVDELFARAPVPEAKVRETPAPAAIVTFPPRSLPAPRSASVLAPLPDPPRATRSFRTTVGYASGALAVLSLSTAAVLGVLAQQAPDGATRREAQTQLERERQFARTANVLWISGGVLTAISVLAFIPLPGAVSTK